MSGASESRPGLNALMQDARRGAFDVVVVFRFDRFARSVKQLVLALEEFRTLGIGFVSQQEALDTSTPMGEAMFAIIAAMAQLERRVIQERVIAGIEHAKARGTKSGAAKGRPRAVFDRASVVGLRQIGRSWRQIAAALSVGVATVRLYSGGVPKPSAKGLGAATQSNALRARDRLCRNDVVLTHWQRPTWRTGVIESLYVSPPRHGFALDTGHVPAGAAC